MIPNKIDFNQMRNKCFCFVCLRFYLEVVRWMLVAASRDH